jgi:hypothetical protein
MLGYVIGNEHAQTKGTIDGTMDTIYETSERIFDHIRRLHTNILKVVDAFKA